jgi:hypothetical protein
VRAKLESQHISRLLVLLLLVVLVLLVGLAMELRRRPLDLAGQRARAAAQISQAELGGEATPLLRATVTLKVIAIPVVELLIAVVLNSLPAFVGLAVIPWLASRFIHALYETEDFKEACSFLHRNVFGMSALRPLLIVQEGHIAVGAGTLYDRIGGCGFIVVHNDSAALLEKGGRLTRIVGPSLGFLDRFERVWGVVDLRHQHWPFTVDAMTKEGIPVSCQADITFKIDDRFVDQWGEVQTKPPVETKPQSFTDIDAAIAAELEEAGIATPLPYTDDAVFNATTGIWVRIRQPEHKEQLRKWTGRVVISGVEGDLRSILADYRLDWLMQPPQPGHRYPREEIRERLWQKLNDSFGVGNRVGARVLNVDLGQIDVKDEKISAQWVEAWQAEWKQRAVESQAEGEAELARLDAARVQAQAEMVLTLTEAIRPLVTSADEIPSYLLAMRFIETLRWMAYDPANRIFLPPETLRMLGALEKLLGEEGAPPGEVAARSNEALTEIKRMLTQLRGAQ